MLQEEQGVTNQEMFKQLSVHWKILDDEEKEPYEEQAEKLWVIYLFYLYR